MVALILHWKTIVSCLNDSKTIMLRMFFSSLYFCTHQWRIKRIDKALKLLYILAGNISINVLNCLKFWLSSFVTSMSFCVIDWLADADHINLNVRLSYVYYWTFVSFNRMEYFQIWYNKNTWSTTASYVIV